MPDWYGEAKKKLQEAIDDIISENYIDWKFAHDSETLNNARDTILDVLVRIEEQVKNPLYPSKKEWEELRGKIEIKDEKNKTKTKKKVKHRPKKAVRKKAD